MVALAPALALVTALVLAPVCRRLAVRVALVDRPRENRFHQVPTPKLGGLVVMVAALPWLLVGLDLDLRAAALLAGLVLAFATGLLDDVYQLAPRWKALGQVAAAAVSVAALSRTEVGWLTPVPDPVLIVVGTLGVVGFQNAVNFLDNMDGISGGVSAIALLALAPLLAGTGLAPAAVIVAGAIAGFLPSNVSSPARLFLGDAGSLPLGHAVGTLAWAAVVAAPGPGWAAAAAATVMIPVTDITFVTAVRLSEGRSPAVGGRDHTTHRLFVRLGSVRRTWITYWTVAALLGLLAFACALAGDGWGIGLLGVVSVLALIAGVRLARMPVPDR